MKNLLLTIAITAGFLQTSSAQSWEWAKQAGALGDEAANKVAVDKAGNVYVTGYFTGATAVFGTITLNNANSAAGGNDIFVAKYDANGNVLWAKQAGGKGSDYGIGIGVDSVNNIYVFGACHDSAKFDATIIVHPVQSTFIAKYDQNGNIIWAKDAGVYRERDMAVDASGNSYIVYQNGMQKWDKDGNMLWEQKSSNANATFTDICADASGNSYFMGNGGGTFDTVVLPDGDFFVKMDPNGTAVSGKTYLTPGITANNSGATSIEVDKTGNVFIASSFQGSVTIEGTTITSQGLIDFFILKYDNAGVFQWVKEDGTSLNETLSFLKADANGNIYTGGYTDNSFPFNFDTLSTQVKGAYIVKMNTNGAALWQKSYSTTAGKSISIKSVAAGTTGDIYVSGGFGGTITLGSTTLTATSGGGLFDGDVYVAKLNPSATTSIESLNFNGTKISIYPNPNNGLFTIVLPENTTNTQLQVLNVLGEMVYNKMISGVSNTIDISNLAAGIYTIKTLSGKQLGTYKFIKQQ